MALLAGFAVEEVVRVFRRDDDESVPPGLRDKLAEGMTRPVARRNPEQRPAVSRRIDSDARTLVLATRAEAAGRGVVGMLVNATGNAIALVYQDASDGRTHLRLGQLSRDGVQWQGIVRMREGMPRLLRWRPTDRHVAYERGLRRRSFLEIIDAAGQVVRETELPRRWQVNDLAWTPDGKRLLAAGNDGVLVWNCE